jgi:cytochrome P450
MPHAVDLASPTLWQDEDRVHAAFADLRAHDPVSWQDEAHSPGVPTRTGYWAVVRHADVVAVSSDARRFSSAAGTSIRSLPDPVNELLGSMLNMDDPRHARLRRIVNRAFTRAPVDALDRRISDLATTLVDDLVRDGGGDFVARVATPLPLRIIADLVGIPPDHHDAVAANSETLGTARDAHALLRAAQELHDRAAALAADRRTDPADDLLTALVHANVDGESLTPNEIGSFFTLLVVAGSQTVRHTLAAGLVALDAHPAELDRWRGDPAAVTPTAVEELVRWVSPVRHFRRTATEDTELAGRAIRAGDKVVLWYTSANRDAAAFDRPDRLDLRRAPNPHVGYGTGPHHCLGARLARRQLEVLFAVLLRRPPWRVTGTERIASSFAAGYRCVMAEW